MFARFYVSVCCLFFFFFQAEDGIRDLVRSRGLGDVYKRQEVGRPSHFAYRMEAVSGTGVEALAGSAPDPAKALSLIHI